MRRGMRFAFVVAGLCVGLVGTGAAGQCEMAELLASDAASEDLFGYSVDIEGDVVIVGAPEDDDGAGTTCNAAYIYRRDGTTWFEEAKLSPSDCEGEDIDFGICVSISGDMAVVGARHYVQGDDVTGAVYVYAYEEPNWDLQALLLPEDGAIDSVFGGSVAIDGEMLIVGAIGDDEFGDDHGSVYWYRWSESEWQYQGKFDPPTLTTVGWFGLSAALDGDLAVIGTAEEEDGIWSYGALVYRFDGAQWTEEAHLPGSNEDEDGYFLSGWTAVRNDLVALGMMLDDGGGPQSGSVYLYRFDEGSWDLETQLSASDGVEGDRFGISVTIGDGVVAVGAYHHDEIGADAGGVYLYDYDGSTWSNETKVLATDGTEGDAFGLDVALDGATLVVGAPYDDDDAAMNAGSVYVLDLIGADCNGNGICDSVEVLSPLYVDDDAVGIGDGTSWDNACTTLSDAISIAECTGLATEIRVAQGTYVPDTTDLADPREATFTLRSSVTIRGGYAGYGAADPDERDVILYETILSGDIGVPEDNSDNCYHVVIADDVDETAELDGLTITAGNADGNMFYEQVGGGILCAGHPCLEACTIAANTAASYGGGLYFGDSTGMPMILNGCTFTWNTANRGGGAYCYLGALMAIKCTFTLNWADNFGGGMFLRVSEYVALADCVFIDNAAGESGGAASATVYWDWDSEDMATTLTAVDCTFFVNSAEDPGGAIHATSAEATLVMSLIECTFGENSSAAEGGAIQLEDRVIASIDESVFSRNLAAEGGAMHNSARFCCDVTSCAFDENSADTNGGAISSHVLGYSYWFKPDLTLDTCDFSDNSSGWGGAVYNSEGALALADCMMHGNYAVYGGGLYSGDDAAWATITGCDFEENTAWAGGGIRVFRSEMAISGCWFGKNVASDAGGGVANLEGIVIIGSSVLCENEPEHIDGYYCDAGGLEFYETCSEVCPADINGDGFVDVVDLLAILAVWGDCPDCPEDITGDGVVDVLDLLEVLGAWGPCE